MLGYNDGDNSFQEGYRLWFNYNDEAVVAHNTGYEFNYEVDTSRFLSGTVYKTEEEAENALAKLREDAAKVLGLKITYTRTIEIS